MSGLTLTISSFSLIIFVSAFLYLLMQVYVQRKLRYLHKLSPQLDTKKLFVMSVWLACSIRVMSFVGLGALNIANVQVNYSMSDYDGGNGDDDGNSDRNQAFYDKAGEFAPPTDAGRGGPGVFKEKGCPTAIF